MTPRILFICTACPFGEAGGSGVRTRHIARLLQKIGPLTIVAATGREWAIDQVEQTRSAFTLERMIRFQAAPNRSLGDQFRKAIDPRFMNTHGLSVAAEDARFVDALVESHDVVWIHGIKTANALGRYHWPKSVLDIDDYPSGFYRASAGLARSPIAKLKHRYVANLWRRREKRCLERFSVVVVCKEGDRSHFGPINRVCVVPNGFEAPPASAPNPRDMGRLGMIGDFNYLPNQDGLKWFVENPWPMIRAQIPGARLRLVGRASPETAARFSSDTIQGLGYVNDPAAEIGTWSAMIVPTRLGGGTHLKVAEGMARRVPIVSTLHGVRGYDVTNGEHALIAQDGPGFAQACVRLLSDSSLRASISSAGWTLFQNRYTWDSLAPAVASAVAACQSFAGEKNLMV